MPQRSADPASLRSQPDPAGFRLAELILPIALATDVGTGAPMDTALRACLLAVRFGEAVGLSDDDLLRERFGVQRVAVIGDLVRPAPLGFWSELTLVAWGLPREHYAIYQVLDELRPRIDIRRAEDAASRQREAFACEVLDVDGA
jgi:hypothetical protein